MAKCRRDGSHGQPPIKGGDMRRMLDEERELRGWHSIMEFISLNKRGYFKDIRKFEKAVREDCAKTADSFHEPPYPSTTSSMYTVPQKIAAAIRRK